MKPRAKNKRHLGGSLSAQNLKRSKHEGTGAATPHFNWKDEEDEEIDSNGSDLSGDDGDDYLVVADEDDTETVQEKRVRLAKNMLAKVRSEESVDSMGADTEAVTERLHKEALHAAGKLTRPVAAILNEFLQKSNGIFEGGSFHRGHNGPVTALVFGKDEDTCWTSSKDCSIIRWDLSSRKCAKKFPGRKANKKERLQKGGASKAVPIGHFDEILTLAASDDGRFLVSGGRDRGLRIWNARTDEMLDIFKGHRDIVSSMCFQRRSRTLFTGSHDRCIKIWNLDEMTYVDTLFGHQSYVLSLDCLGREQPVSGSDDKSVHLWKVEADSQLIFRGHKRSVESVAMIDDQNYVSASQDGMLALWNLNKKNPIAKVHAAHPKPKGFDESGENHFWVNAVTAFSASDLIATGSCDGFIRFWHVNLIGKQSLTEVGRAPANGFVNALSFSPNGKYLVAGIGQEPRLGRWERDKTCKNGIFVLELPDFELKV
jgi:ribosomal RNA-processing protein 9